MLPQVRSIAYFRLFINLLYNFCQRVKGLFFVAFRTILFFIPFFFNVLSFFALVLPLSKYNGFFSGIFYLSNTVSKCLKTHSHPIIRNNVISPYLRLVRSSFSITCQSISALIFSNVTLCAPHWASSCSAKVICFLINFIIMRQNYIYISFNQLFIILL